MQDLSGVFSISGRPVSPDWIILGEHSYYAHHLAVGSWLPGEKVIIGDYCSIADQVVIMTGGNRRTDQAANYPVDVLGLNRGHRRSSPRPPVGVSPIIAKRLGAIRNIIPVLIPGRSYRSTRNTTIGNDVWIGYGAMIVGGASVGDGAVIATGSVVFSDVPPYAIVAGNPAKIVRSRFSPAVVERLLGRRRDGGKRRESAFEALRDVTLTIRQGQTFGIIGRNGSGKSTLLKLVAGITKPSDGTVKVHGRISALIELGAGFHPEISGRENVFINGIMLGLTKREVTERFDEIVEFAEMKEFIDAPVKTYSSGMYMRLGFAVAIHVDPGVLLVDEVLAVGDEGFTHKCLDKFAEFKRRGKTILLVTHSLGLVERFCDEALWLDAGRVRGSGDPKRIVGAYITDVERREDALVGNLAVEDQFRIAGALELFENHFVHAAAGVDQRGGDDGQRTAFFDVTRGAEEALRAL